MGSRSKFHKAKGATTPGRALLHGPRPKKPLVVRFTDAVDDLINTNAKPAVAGNRNRRRRGMRALDLPTLAMPHAERPAPTASGPEHLPRAYRRAHMLACASSYAKQGAGTRAERRRAARTQARKEFLPARVTS